MQHQITKPGPLLNPQGRLDQVGWSRQPLLDCNLEQAAFYPPLTRFFQKFRLKRWDYYALFTPQRFFSATIADLGYAANVFVYTLDWRTGQLHEEGMVLPASSVSLPRLPGAGEARFDGKQARLVFKTVPGERQVLVDWPAFDHNRGLRADLHLRQRPDHESMNIVIPIAGRRFYYNHKINCLPAQGLLYYGEQREEISPGTSLASLDWGRGVWQYRSYWNWASASGFLPDGRTLGLNLGCGFGDTSQATENAFILNGRLHKLNQVTFDYTPGDYMRPWKFRDDQGRLDLTFTPFKDRTARSNLLVITSQVHQMFGRYAGTVTADDGERISIDGLVGFAEEHHARW